MVSMDASGQRLLGIDWGTSNRRAYLVDASGACLDAHEDDQGILAAGPGFGPSLARLLAAMKVQADVPVLASGMIGSAQGWHATPYLDIAVALAELPSRLVRVQDEALDRDCLLVPGYSQVDADGAHADVMRGEETQLLGALVLEPQRSDGWFVLPGTHSKWVRVERGLIRGMHTFMTGELFATLGKQGTLAPLMNGPDDAAAFAAGVDEARRGAPLSQSLFGVRARVMTNTLPAAQARSCVSGLLIGAELLAARELVGAAAQDIVSIAAPGLHARYAAAAGRVGLALRALDPDRVYRAALSHFIKEIEP
jgi:2-dehydro-3-deoxygalactonokinase